MCYHEAKKSIINIYLWSLAEIICCKQCIDWSNVATLYGHKEGRYEGYVTSIAANEDLEVCVYNGQFVMFHWASMLIT